MLLASLARLGLSWRSRPVDSASAAHQRIITAPRARYFNVDGSLDALAESAPDRVRFAPSSTEVRGLELLAQYDGGGHVRVGASLVFSRATATPAGRNAPRPFDEPGAATIEFVYAARAGGQVRRRGLRATRTIQTSHGRF